MDCWVDPYLPYGIRKTTRTYTNICKTNKTNISTHTFTQKLRETKQIKNKRNKRPNQREEIQEILPTTSPISQIRVLKKKNRDTNLRLI